MECDSGSDVEYTWLSSNCGLRVSKVCFGGATFATDQNALHKGQTAEDASFVLLDRYAALGGNFIDTANIYSNGDSERIIGNWLARQPERDQYVIASKLRGDASQQRATNFSGQGTPFPNRVGLSRQAIIKNVELSLHRLNTHYIDLYQIHGFDAGVPVEETLETIDGLIKLGKIRYFGGSNLRGWQTQKYVEVARRMGLSSNMVTLQQQYNLVNRESEWEAFEVCQNEGIGILAWSPLKGGLLSGKFKRDQDLDTSTRVGWATLNAKASHPAPDFNQYKDDMDFWEIMNTVDDIAKSKGRTAAQVAMRWILQRPSVTSIISGAHTLKQLEDNMVAASGTWSLTDSEMQTLNDLSSIKVPYPYDIDSGLNSARKRNLIR